MLLLYPSSQLDPRAPDEICAEEYAAAASLGLRVAKQQGEKAALMLKPKGLASSSPGLAPRLARVGDVYSHTPTVLSRSVHPGAPR